MCKALPDDKTPARGKVPMRTEYVVSDYTTAADSADEVSTVECSEGYMIPAWIYIYYSLLRFIVSIVLILFFILRAATLTLCFILLLYCT